MGLITAKLTYEHLRQLPDDGLSHELIEGDIVVSPSPKWRHQRIVHHIHDLLSRAEKDGAGLVAGAPTDVVLDPELNALQPDLLFIASGRVAAIVRENNVQGAPDLVVEVLSNATAARDLGVKLRVYARYGVRWYWIVDPDAETVRICTQATEGYVQGPDLHGDDLLTCPLFPGVTTTVSEIFNP